MARDDRREEMRELLALRDSCGLTYRELAEETGVPAQTLSWWAWKLRREGLEKPAFLELELAPDGAARTIDVEAPSGHVVRVPPDFDSETLQRLLSVLAAC